MTRSSGRPLARVCVFLFIAVFRLLPSARAAARACDDYRPGAWIGAAPRPGMLRKTLYLFLALIACALIVAVFDGVRHARALARLEERGVYFQGWCYRISGGSAADPENATSKLRAWLQWMIAAPRIVVLANTTVEESMVRDLAVLRIESLHLRFCQGLSPAVMKQLSGISSIQWFDVAESNLTDEGLNLVWSGLPDLEGVIVTSDRIGPDGLRDIHRARKLRTLELDLGRPEIGDWVLARVREAAGVEELGLGGMRITEATAALLAGMPALREVSWMHDDPDAGLIEKLETRNPPVKVYSPSRQR